MKKFIYLDNNATTKTDPEVLEVMKKYYLEMYANPSSIHDFGQKVRQDLEKAREKVANFLGCSPEEIIFTSGGTEAINTAIKGIAFANMEKGKHIITSQIEHKAVLNTCKYLSERFGFEITYLPVDKYGMVSPEDVKKSIRGSEYVLTGSAKSATFTYGGGDFTLVIRGERNVVSSYVDVILRLISGNTIKCPSCGTELDSEVITCPSCGLKYPFTLPSCPKCGTGSVYRRCPKCGSLITYRGLKVVKDKTPAVVFSATALAILGLGALIGNLIIGLVGAAIVGSVGAIMWFAAPVLTVSRG